MSDTSVLFVSPTLVTIVYIYIYICMLCMHLSMDWQKFMWNTFLKENYVQCEQQSRLQYPWSLIRMKSISAYAIFNSLCCLHNCSGSPTHTMSNWPVQVCGFPTPNDQWAKLCRVINLVHPMHLAALLLVVIHIPLRVLWVLSPPLLNICWWSGH